MRSPPKALPQSYLYITVFKIAQVVIIPEN
jgi:hypothetical protein